MDSNNQHPVQSASIDTSGFLLSEFPFLEYLEGTTSWSSWEFENRIEQEHTLFFSSFTYGLIQFRNRFRYDAQSETVRQKFRQLRHSSLNARILDLDSLIMDMAAQICVDVNADLRGKGDSEFRDITPYLEWATAGRWNLTLVISNDANDKFRRLHPYLDEFVEMRVC